MASREYEELRKVLKPGLAIASDPTLVVREKMMAVHPTQYSGDVVVEEAALGGVPAAFVRTPEVGDTDRTLLMVHGGAFVSTGIPQYIPYAEHVARAVRARIVVFEYRLAPEHRHPAALDDTLAAYRGLLEHGLPPERIGLIGDSCGGGIALAGLLALRDAGDPLPACYAGITPWLDAAQQGDAALHPRGLDPYVEAEWIRCRFRDYAGPEGDLRSPRISPVEGNFAGLPPLYFSVGQIDTTSDDSTRVAARAGRDGVFATVEVVPEMIHGFHGLSALIPEGREALGRIGEFVRRHVP